MAVVLITGCRSGIGLQTALAFARRGDRVYATSRDVVRADQLRQSDSGRIAGTMRGAFSALASIGRGLETCGQLLRS